MTTGAFAPAYDPGFDAYQPEPGIRQRIAQALSGVSFAWSGGAAELSGYPSRPAALATWQGFPDWQSSRWLTRCVVEHTWNVYVILPGADPESFTSATDLLLPLVRDALIQVGHVQQVSPIALVAADQALTMPALNFQLLT